MWAKIGELVAGEAGALVLDYFKGQYFPEEDVATRNRELIIGAIRRLQSTVIGTLISLEINELRGSLEGSLVTYAAYDPDPGSRSEEERLREISDSLSITIGRAGGHLDTLGDRPARGRAINADDQANRRRLAFDAWPLYTPLVFLRAQVMAERERTFGAQEVKDIPPMLDTALQRNTSFLRYLQRESDSRFPGGIEGMAGTGTGLANPAVLAYRFNGVQTACGLASFPDSRARCVLARERHMAEAFSTFEPVAGVRVALARLESLTGAVNAYLASRRGPGRLSLPLDELSDEPTVTNDQTDSRP